MPTRLTFLSPDLHFCPSDLHISDHPTSTSLSSWCPYFYPSRLRISTHPTSTSVHLSSTFLHTWPSTSLTSFPSDLHIFTGLTYTFLYIWLHLPHPSRAPHQSLHNCDRPAPHLWHYSTHLTSTLLATWPQYFKPIHLTFTDISTHLTSTFLSILVTTNFHIHSALPTCSKSLIMQPPLLADSIAHPTSTYLFSTLHPQLWLPYLHTAHPTFAFQITKPHLILRNFHICPPVSQSVKPTILDFGISQTAWPKHFYYPSRPTTSTSVVLLYICLVDHSQSSGAVWKSTWPFCRAPVPNKPTVSVDVTEATLNHPTDSQSCPNIPRCSSPLGFTATPAKSAEVSSPDFRVPPVTSETDVTYNLPSRRWVDFFYQSVLNEDAPFPPKSEILDQKTWERPFARSPF